MNRVDRCSQSLLQRLIQLRLGHGASLESTGMICARNVGCDNVVVANNQRCRRGGARGICSVNRFQVQGVVHRKRFGHRYMSTKSGPKSGVSAPIDLHDEFLSNINDEGEAPSAAGSTHSASIRFVNKTKSSGSKDRFRHGEFSEGDMYSAKPVWQQLNEIESTWNMQFRRKGRVESQRAISRAKKSVEALDAIEANDSRLVNIDSFREAGGVDRNDPAASAGFLSSVPHPAPPFPDQRGVPPGLHSAANPNTRRMPSVVGDGYKNAPVRVGKGAVAPTAGGSLSSNRWMDKGNVSASVPPGGFLVNDLHLPGDQYYEAVSLEGDSVDGITVSAKELNLDPEEEKLRASLAPSVFLGRLLNNSERSVVEGIFGNKEAGVIDAATPAAVIESETKLEPETWLNMNPAHIVLQQSILKCRSSSQILIAIGDKLDKMNAVNASTALHRLARHTTSYSRYSLTSNDTFCRLLAVLERHLLDLDSQGLTNVLWSVVRLGVQPNWLDALLAAINNHANDLTPSELASCLFAMSKLPVKTATSVDLRDRVIALAQERVSHFKRPLDLTCIATALARLNVRNPVLFGRISSSVLAVMNDFTLQQLCGIAWSFASLGFTDRALFARIRQFLEEHASAGNMHDVVHLAWALSKVREADSEVFLCTISPLVRAHVSHLTCRDITTVAWAFVNAEIDDPDLFEDLACALQHHVDEMGTHDVAAAVAAFAHMEESHKALFKKMRNRALLMASEFTPLQLAKIVRGFSSVADERFYSQLCRSIESKVHLMLPENVVEVLMGLTEAGHVPPSLLKQLLTAVSSGVCKMYAEDCLLLFQVALRLKRDCNDRVTISTLDKLQHALVEQIEARVGRWKCYNISHITSYFECLSGMGIGGSKGDASVRILSKQLSSCLNRLGTAKLPTEDRNHAFASFISACASLPPRKLAVFQAELSKSPELMASMHNCVAALRSGDYLASESSPISHVDACYCLVRMGYLDDGVVSLCDELVESYSDPDKLDLSDPKTLDKLSKTIWLLMESNLHVAWVRERLRAVAEAQFTPSASDSLIRLLWSSAVLGEDELLMSMLPKFVPVFDRLPEDMLSAQQVALHVLRCLPVDTDTSNGQSTSSTSDANNTLSNSVVSCTGERYLISSEVHNTLVEWLDYQRDDLFTVTPGSRKKRALELDYDAVLSETLISMKIPHKTVHTVANIYRVSVAFPMENHVLDVLNFTDCFVPHGQPRSRALLRQRQLQLLGYGVASVNLGSVYATSREGSCKPLIAKAISGFVETAADYLPATTQ
ncbi:kynurenine 3-monooxygenase and-related flavo monooxygenase family protein, putative [Babesia ovata]|uniref:Kynurenine 3-monooxygenase and-related flavo monooxygenase family protein, putative n=1 Tax=Babesia ovata TaxID=189622 RepID=A0A2H6K6F3_9APIC|nr:kynurenine 3-monooxygenase and-related flavo monooxygenase family protein, putative [Babesia ovata]GBE58566.1 kynurenine 3-monooxygenase and-related flavo monooxygenase family protein, putative [Babesia ovata]